MPQNTKNDTKSYREASMRMCISADPGQASRRRNTTTSFITLLLAAGLAIGATTALAATGRDAREATIQRVREQQPKLERKDRWERKAVTFDSMWRERR